MYAFQPYEEMPTADENAIYSLNAMHGPYISAGAEKARAWARFVTPDIKKGGREYNMHAFKKMQTANEMTICSLNAIHGPFFSAEHFREHTGKTPKLSLSKLKISLSSDFQVSTSL